MKSHVETQSHAEAFADLAMEQDHAEMTWSSIFAKKLLFMDVCPRTSGIWLIEKHNAREQIGKIIDVFPDGNYMGYHKYQDGKNDT